MSRAKILKPRKPKIEKVDGLGPDDIKKIRAAIRQVWQWSHAPRLVVKRCTDAGGFGVCEKCEGRCPKVKVDHIKPVGDVDEGFIARLFVPSTKMQGLCKRCHDAKTKEERKANKPKRRIKDFF